jgi:hypothetical protein
VGKIEKSTTMLGSSSKGTRRKKKGQQAELMLLLLSGTERLIFLLLCICFDLGAKLRAKKLMRETGEDLCYCDPAGLLSTPMIISFSTDSVNSATCWLLFCQYVATSFFDVTFKRNAHKLS